MFFARGCGRSEGRGNDRAAHDTLTITRRDTARLCDFAFGLAWRREAHGKPRRLSNVNKANVFGSMAF
jgi:3-isopropylmalate dehydrogenase